MALPLASAGTQGHTEPRHPLKGCALAVEDPVSDSPSGSKDEPIPELVQLGERLHQARQQKGLTLSDVAERLHIGADQLQALESGDRTRLREPVFVIAQAKRVAGALGVDIHQQIEGLRGSDLMRTPPRPHPHLAAPVHADPRPPRNGHSTGSSTRRAQIWPKALVAALGLGALTLMAAQLLSPGGWNPLRNLSAVPGLSGSPDSDNTPPVPDPAVKPPAQRPADAPQGSSPDVPKAAELVLRASGPSWLTVRNANGTILFEGTVTGEQRFPLGAGLEVRAGRPDLVQASIGAGPARVLGPINQIQWKSFKPSP